MKAVRGSFRLLWFAQTAALAVASLEPAPCWAIRQDHPWHQRTWEELDSGVPGWFVNLGPTGARGILHDLDFEVAYVQPGSPADGVLELGDLICGANGKRFAVKHSFGWGADCMGGEGPLMDLGNAILASEGDPQLDGCLSLIIKRAGQELRTSIAIERLGKFSDTYPYDCARSDLMLKQICGWLASRQREDGSWPGHEVVTSIAGFVLLASGDRQYNDHIRRAAEQQMRIPAYQEGGHNWRLTYGSVLLAEYYLASRHIPSRKNRILGALRVMDAGLTRNVRRDGTTQHRKIGDPGGAVDYPELAVMSGLVLISQALMRDCGLDIAADRTEAVQAYLKSVTCTNGYVCYCRKERIARGDDFTGYWAVDSGDWGRTGVSVLGFLASNGDAHYLNRCVDYIHKHPKWFPEAHGSTGMGIQWSAIALARAAPATFRDVMDYHRWYWALARCPDGSFVAQPRRNDASCDYYLLPRDWMTATIGLILAIKDARLRIMGAELENHRF